MQYTYNSGRIFISPIIGCKGGCKYCYLSYELMDFNNVRKNRYDIDAVIDAIKKDKEFIRGKNGTIISIGAYCDIFPKGDTEGLIQYSIDWIIECLKIGNPIQIISKNILNEEFIQKISENIQYSNQLLYSTTITTFCNWRNVEPFSASPEERISTMNLFKKYNIPTNLMIKPFIPGITEKDVDKFKEIAHSNSVDYVVVGELYLINSNMNKEIIRGSINQEIETNNRILDCTGNKSFRTVEGKMMQKFIKEISGGEKYIFRKSSCINANLLGVNNQGEYYKTCKGIYCIKCGNCK